MSDENPLGRSTAYPDQYTPDLLYAIARIEARSALGIDDEAPFRGVDIWNAWDLTWLDPDGQPRTGTAEIRVPADSPNLVESKSLKLYLGSLAMSPFDGEQGLAEVLARDLSDCTGGKVRAVVRGPGDSEEPAVAALPGVSVDSPGVGCDTYEVEPGFLAADGRRIVTESLHSNLLRSLCPVTAQPDIGSVLVAYRGPRIDRAGLLRYIVSFRRHQDFHEACVERMFMDILERCGPGQLTVYARYQRRGGIDINPLRSNIEDTAPNTRTWRQ